MRGASKSERACVRARVHVSVLCALENTCEYMGEREWEGGRLKERMREVDRVYEGG